MFTGGEDCSARIWDLRTRNLQCQRVYQVKAPVNCVILHPNQVRIINLNDDTLIVLMIVRSITHHIRWI